MKYTTLTNLKSFLGINTSDYDTQLQNLIDRVSKQFDNYLWRNLWINTYIDYVDISDDTLVIVNYWPIVSISSIQDEDWNTIEYKRTDGNMIFLKESFDWIIKIEYDAWYSSIDDILDVEQSCLEVCSDLWGQTPSNENEDNVKSKKIETLSKTYFSKQEMRAWNIDYRETLDNYKIFSPVMI